MQDFVILGLLGGCMWGVGVLMGCMYGYERGVRETAARWSDAVERKKAADARRRPRGQGHRTMRKEPVGEHYVRKLLAMSSCFVDGQGSNVCFSEPCACAQSLLQAIGRPLEDEIERLAAKLKRYEDGEDLCGACRPAKDTKP